jgi:hypothetical protein
MNYYLHGIAKIEGVCENTFQGHYKILTKLFTRFAGQRQMILNYWRVYISLLPTFSSVLHEPLFTRPFDLYLK